MLGSVVATRRRPQVVAATATIGSQVDRIMLVLTRRVGESVRIGDGVRLTIRSKLRSHLTIAVAAPTHLAITDDADVAVRPVRRRHRRGKRYLIAILLGDSLRLGEEIVVSFGGDGSGGCLDLARGRQVRIGIDAPRDVPVHREEVYHRIRDEERSLGGERR